MMTRAATALDDADRALLRDLLAAYEHGTELPKVQVFRVAHEAERSRIDRLRHAGLLGENDDRYALTLAGLRACDSESARRAHTRCAAIVELLRDAYRADPEKTWTADQFGAAHGLTGEEPARLIPLLRELPMWATLNVASKTGFAAKFRPSEAILDIEPLVWSEAAEGAEGTPEGVAEPRITSIEISGYRPFSGFSASPGDLMVVIGANASGKSSLFDVLRLLKSAAMEPLPPEIDRNSVGKTLFHVGGPERIDLALTIDMGQKKPLRYELTIRGPVGAPHVAREKLATEEPPGGDAQPPFVFLDFTNGKGVVRDQLQKALARPPWTLPPNELALRRALDPTLVTLSKVQAFISSWSFYSGFDVSQTAEIRRPTYIEENPTLAADGANLSAVLSWIRDEHTDVWEELQMHLRNVVPGFVSLGVKARGGKGMAIGVWREEGLKDELTLADLSDGTLRLLCWLTLALSPNLPPLVCIDEPEIGLHPRVLPLLAGVLQLAAARAQLFVATHSPHLLSQFDIEDIAVMRKESGRVVFVRPSTSEALRNEVREIGGDALARLFISRELEVLP